MLMAKYLQGILPFFLTLGKWNDLVWRCAILKELHMFWLFSIVKILVLSCFLSEGGERYFLTAFVIMDSHL